MYNMKMFNIFGLILIFCFLLNIQLKATVIGNWKLDETSGTIVNDSSPNTNNGTMYNMDTTTCRVLGKTGNSLEFDGDDDYVDCGNDSSLLPSGSFTLSAWLYSRLC